MVALDEPRAGAIADMVLASIHREYPHHLSHLVRSAADARTPRELTPAFFGSFDWHSSVHSHWCLARMARVCPTAAWRAMALSAVGESLTPDRLSGELAYLMGEGRQGFERPYGLAWLLQLCAELREWTADPRAERTDVGSARVWLASLVALETLAAERVADLCARLPWPVRGGEHSQTAFAFGLVLDWAGAAGRADVGLAMRARAEEFFGADRAAPVAYEPSGHDFLSPALGEADLMRRVLSAARFADWLERFLPEPTSAAARAWLTPVVSPDRADGKLSHLDGLNLSRAWMLEGIAAALPHAHPWRAPLARAADAHAAAGLAAVPARHYAGAHWLGSYAVYLLTRRGLEGAAATGTAAT
jgi:DUF2891 family protein